MLVAIEQSSLGRTYRLTIIKMAVEQIYGRFNFNIDMRTVGEAKMSLVFPIKYIKISKYLSQCARAERQENRHRQCGVNLKTPGSHADPGRQKTVSSHGCRDCARQFHRLLGPHLGRMKTIAAVGWNRTPLSVKTSI